MKYLTVIIVGIALAYIGMVVWNMSGIFFPTTCKSNEANCITPFQHQNKFDWNLEIYSSVKKPSKFSPTSKSPIFKRELFVLSEPFTEKLNITIPKSTRNNGTLFMYFLLLPSDRRLANKYAQMRVTEITMHSVPVTYFQLLEQNITDEQRKKSSMPVTHLRTKVQFHIMNQNFNINGKDFPGEIHHLIKFVENNQYLPILFPNEISYSMKDLMEVKNNEKMMIQISYSPLSIGMLRMYAIMGLSFQSLQSYGFTETDIDDIKGIFTDTSLMFLALTFFVSTFHLLFDILAFKHDVHYWKQRKTMEGLSSHSVIFRCISTIIIFLYLADKKTSFLVLGPAFVGAIIEIWKVTKAVKLNVSFESWRPRIELDSSSEKEKTTENYDHEAIKYLSYVLYPLCIIGALYSLFHVPHTSWYSWVIQSLVNGVYAFGFLFMLPQLFINYKLKSVAHLPWKAFMYKAFNTFIDDVFAFIIRMPTSHRLACFRDDIVFFCYLYQRWLYPIDKSRVNEFGISYEDEKQELKKEK